jgi:hypothetical protein
MSITWENNNDFATDERRERLNHFQAARKLNSISNYLAARAIEAGIGTRECNDYFDATIIIIRTLQNLNDLHDILTHLADYSIGGGRRGPLDHSIE